MWPDGEVLRAVGDEDSILALAHANVAEVSAHGINPECAHAPIVATRCAIEDGSSAADCGRR